VLKVTRLGEVTRFDVARTLWGRGRYWTTCYLVGATMIDTGCAHGAPELLAALDGSSLERVLTSHTHEDHIGGHGPLKRSRPGLEIFAHPLALPVLENPWARQPLHPYRRVMWGWPEPCEGIAVADGDLIEAGDLRFQVVHTPGHSPEHLCFYEPDRGWLFTGDLYVGGLDRAIRAGYDIWQIIESLKRVAALEVRLLFPGAARVPDDPSAALRTKIDHLEQLGGQVLELRHRGLSVAEISRRLCGAPMWIELITLGHFTRRNLVRSYLRRNSDPSEIRWREGDASLDGDPGSDRAHFGSEVQNP
jgi:glyoxylase-like metal-dependent hydrolase (beta-lactamase superfamily II)